MKKKQKRSLGKLLVGFVFLITLMILGYSNPHFQDSINDIFLAEEQNATVLSFALSDIPAYEGTPFVYINDNKPNFDLTNTDTSKGFENYSKLDSLGRCRVAYANICKETMPSEDDERGDINSVKPTGWNQAKYDGEYLYNRCHLIGYQLSNENANEQNLITGTKYLNIEGMLPFENQIAEYIKNNSINHVLYRVTPIFTGNNLLASGVQMEAWSVEDNGQGVCFNVYCYNVQPGIVIDYSTGESHEEI